MSSLRDLPAIDELLRAAPALLNEYGREAVVRALRQVVDEARQAVRAGGAVPSEAELLTRAAVLLAGAARPTLRPVINATGVILHTNLGRAPLSAEALAALMEVGSGYSTLEYDLDTGARGKRDHHAERLLTQVTGASSRSA